MGKHNDLIQKEHGVYTELVRMQMMSGEDDISNTESKSRDEEGDRSRAGSAHRRRTLSKDTPQDSTADAVAETVVEEAVEAPVDKVEKRQIMRRIFALIGQYPGYVVLGLMGALFFGAIFPCWGLMLAKTQSSFFLDDAEEIRKRARLYAFFYILLAGVAFFGSLAMFYGVVAVSC